MTARGSGRWACPIVIALGVLAWLLPALAGCVLR